MRYCAIFVFLFLTMVGCRQEPEKKAGPNEPEPKQEVPEESEGDQVAPAVADFQEKMPDAMMAADTLYTRTGRTLLRENGVTELIGSASSVRFRASGDTVSIAFEVPGNDHAYALVTRNDKLSWKYKLSAGKKTTVAVPLATEQQWNEIGVYKLTEAMNGVLLFNGASADGLRTTDYAPELTIEFIGNSITCGYGVDDGQVACGEGVYFDQHNPYEAFAAKAARTMGAGYSLSCVSGAGIYRNYDAADTLALPERYTDLYLGAAGVGSYPPDNWNPDIVSICLGTNDIAAPDAGNDTEFNQETFVGQYIDFINSLRGLYPEAAFVLVDSPMLSEGSEEVLQASLEQVRDHFSNDLIIRVLNFDGVGVSGCEYHPGIQDHDQMARQLRSFIIRTLDEIAEREEMSMS